MLTAQPCEAPNKAKHFQPSGINHRFEITHEGIEGNVAELPSPRAHFRARRQPRMNWCSLAIHLSIWLHTGLSQSYSRWFSQLPAFTSGGPLPTVA